MKYETFAYRVKEINEGAQALLAREVVTRSPHALIGDLHEAMNPVNQLRELLGSQEMRELIDSGNITIGMVKPRLDVYMDLDKVQVTFGDDVALERHVLNMIEQPLEVLAEISMQMTPEMVNKFYSGNPKENMQASFDEPDGRSVWDHFNDLMASGPVTFLVIGSSEGDAIGRWRQAIGKSWDVTKSSPGELRHLMRSNSNNGFHGSDKPQAVKDEIKFIAKHMI